MSAYACEPDGIYTDIDGRMQRLCPPVAVLGTLPDPLRPAGKLIHLAWTEHADQGEWHEAHLPSPMVANSATLEAILGGTGWYPIHDGWHSAVCDAVLPFLQGEDADASRQMSLAI